MNTTMTARMWSVWAAMLVFGPAAPQLAAQVSQPELQAPGLLLHEKRYAEAAEEYGRLISRLTPEQRFLAPRLEFNRATALLSAGQVEQATAALLKIDEETNDTGLRAAARANLAHLAAVAGEAAAESDTARAIEHYQRAERLYRNALPGTPTDQREAIARNVEVVQRRIARLLEKQKQEPQQQQQNQQNQPTQDQQKQEQQSKPDQQQNKDQQQGKDGQQGEQKDQQQPGQGEENKPEQGKEQSRQPEHGKQPEKPEEGAEDQKQQRDSAAQQGQSQAQQANPRDFDRAAAEILDKERKQRERIRQMLLRMRRAAPVEKDW